MQMLLGDSYQALPSGIVRKETRPRAQVLLSPFYKTAVLLFSSYHQKPSQSLVQPEAFCPAHAPEDREGDLLELLIQKSLLLALSYSGLFHVEFCLLFPFPLLCAKHFLSFTSSYSYMQLSEKSNKHFNA